MKFNEGWGNGGLGVWWVSGVINAQDTNYYRVPHIDLKNILEIFSTISFATNKA